MNKQGVFFGAQKRAFWYRFELSVTQKFSYFKMFADLGRKNERNENSSKWNFNHVEYDKYDYRAF